MESLWKRCKLHEAAPGSFYYRLTTQPFVGISKWYVESVEDGRVTMYRIGPTATLAEVDNLYKQGLLTHEKEERLIMSQREPTVALVHLLWDGATTIPCFYRKVDLTWALQDARQLHHELISRLVNDLQYHLRCAGAKPDPDGVWPEVRAENLLGREYLFSMREKKLSPTC